MSTLRIISEAVPQAVLQLQPGVITIGRQEGNQFQIIHPTVSGRHCQLSFVGGRVLITDLTSTNGTYVNDQRVQEATLEPGQVLRLGDIGLIYEAAAISRLHLEAGAPPENGQITPDQRAISAIQRPCYKHPQTEGQWICSQCRTVCCDGCSGKRVTSGKTWRRCGLCGAKVLSLEDHQKQQEAMALRNSLRFTQRLSSAFKYPFVKGGMLLLVLGTIIYWMVGIAQIISKCAPVYGLMASGILLVFSWGWLFAYIQKIIVSCSNDEDILPDWPEISDWSGDLAHPFLLCLGTLAICFGPGIAYSWYSAEHDLEPLFFYAFFFLGLIYMPMALLAVALTGSLKSANPFVVLPAITKAPRDYLIVCLLFLGGLGIWNGLLLVSKFINPFGKDPIATFGWKMVYSLPLGFVFLYCLVVCIRALGMMYRCNRAKFGWFKDF